MHIVFIFIHIGTSQRLAVPFWHVGVAQDLSLLILKTAVFPSLFCVIHVHMFRTFQSDRCASPNGRGRRASMLA